MANENLKTYDWDDEVELTEDQERGGQETSILPDGKYPFEVIKTEKQWYDGGAKIPACNMAKVFLRIDGGELGSGLVVENIYLAEGFEWKAGAFLRAIGIRSHGDKLEFKKPLRDLRGRVRRPRRTDPPKQQAEAVLRQRGRGPEESV